MTRLVHRARGGNRPLGAASGRRSENGAFAPSDVPAPRNDRTPFAWFFGLATALTATALIVYGFASPEIRRDLSRENGVIEMPTAVLFLAAVVVGIVWLRRIRARRADARWLIPGLSLLGMLDEANWIVFPLGLFRRPTILEHRVDGLHDFVEIAVDWLLHEAPGWAVVALGVAAAAVLAWAAPTVLAWWPALKRSPAWHFVALALVLTALAQAFDLFASQRNLLARLCEEVLELDAALAMVFAAWLIPRVRAGAPGRRS